jgi:hypothetical protein
MALRDHFRSPVADRHDWPSFHSQWAGSIAAYLNRKLPPRYIAESPAHLGLYVETDVAEFEQHDTLSDFQSGLNGNGSGAANTAVATEPQTYAPPQPAATWPLTYPPVFQVKVHDLKRHRLLVAVVELVSPANKDRPETREQFAAKALDYLAAGVGLIVLDVVTTMAFNLHNELVRVGRFPAETVMPDGPPIYAAAYRPVYRKKQDLIDVWPFPLTIGETLPTVPLALRGYGCVAIDLEKTYGEACERCRIE